MGMIQAPMLAAASGNDVDFMVHGLIPLNFFGHKVWITTTHVTTLIVMLFIMALALIARRSIMKEYEKPSGLANAVELVVEMLDNQTIKTCGLCNCLSKKHRRHDVSLGARIASYGCRTLSCCVSLSHTRSDTCDQRKARSDC